MESTFQSRIQCLEHQLHRYAAAYGSQQRRIAELQEQLQRAIMEPSPAKASQLTEALTLVATDAAVRVCDVTRRLWSTYFTHMQAHMKDLLSRLEVAFTAFETHPTACTRAAFGDTQAELRRLWSEVSTRGNSAVEASGDEGRAHAKRLWLPPGNPLEDEQTVVQHLALCIAEATSPLLTLALREYDSHTATSTSNNNNNNNNNEDVEELGDDTRACGVVKPRSMTGVDAPHVLEASVDMEATSHSIHHDTSWADVCRVNSSESEAESSGASMLGCTVLQEEEGVSIEYIEEGVRKLYQQQGLALTPQQVGKQNRRRVGNDSSQVRDVPYSAISNNSNNNNNKRRSCSSNGKRLVSCNSPCRSATATTSVSNMTTCVYTPHTSAARNTHQRIHTFPIKETENSEDKHVVSNPFVRFRQLRMQEEELLQWLTDAAAGRQEHGSGAMYYAMNKRLARVRSERLRIEREVCELQQIKAAREALRRDRVVREAQRVQK